MLTLHEGLLTQHSKLDKVDGCKLWHVLRALTCCAAVLPVKDGWWVPHDAAVSMRLHAASVAPDSGAAAEPGFILYPAADSSLLETQRELRGNRR